MAKRSDKTGDGNSAARRRGGKAAGTSDAAKPGAARPSTAKRSAAKPAGAGPSAAKSGGAKPDTATRILHTALDIAEERGWRAVRLVDVAAQLGMPPTQILDHYRDRDALADAWFRHGLDAMLAPKPKGFADWPARDRVEHCMTAWFDALAPHRRVTAEMLQVKANPSHPHTWVPMIFNLSRTIHWLREAALLPATYGSRRADTEEIGLTWLFAAVLWVWVRDETEGQDRTRRFLARRLDQADRTLARLFGRRAPMSTEVPTG